jgi:hypothetical protein
MRLCSAVEINFEEMKKKKTLSGQNRPKTQELSIWQKFDQSEFFRKKMKRGEKILAESGVPDLLGS